MKKTFLFVSISIFIVISVAASIYWYAVRPFDIPQIQQPDTVNQEQMHNNEASDVLESKSERVYIMPIAHASERITKKPFGILINPKTSPVQPERFSGYHTGTDFEIFPEEASQDVVVSAVCSGNIIEKRRASGYGGVLVQRCALDNQSVTVVYGHLSLSSINKGLGDILETGEKVGLLGMVNSVDTGGERKHLHLSIHKGTTTNISGYVANKTELNQWIDPCKYFCGQGK